MESHGLLDKLLKEPETAVEKLDLIYVGDERLTIERIKEKRDFVYIYHGKPLRKKAHLERIRSLVIPPAWEGVRISDLPNGHLQAIGKDLKKRKQYRYHPVWIKVRSQTKFYKMAVFGEQLPKIRKQVEKDLQQRGWPKSKVLALVVRLMEETHIRIGNEQYAKRNRTYGLSTLRKKHIDVYKDKIRFRFTGKRGKEHEVTLRNRRLVHLVSKCEEIPGWELFRYYDEDGKKQNIDSGMVNEYIHAISNDFFTAKDFRTWAATTIFFDTLSELEITSDPDEIHKNLLKSFDAAAKALGNTRNVCRKYYVHPLLVKRYEDGSLKNAFKALERIKVPKPFLSPSEEIILGMIKEYKPRLSA